MHTQIDKSTKNEHKSVSNSIASKEITKTPEGFIDNRIESVSQRKLLDLMREGAHKKNNSVFQTMQNVAQRTPIYTKSRREVPGTRDENTLGFRAGFALDTMAKNAESKNEYIDYLIGQFRALPGQTQWDADMILWLEGLKPQEEPEQQPEQESDSGDMEEPEEGPTERVAGLIYDGVGGYICGTNMKEKDKPGYGNGGVCSVRFEQCKNYFEKKLASGDKDGRDFWMFSAKKGKVDHVAFCIGPLGWTGEEADCWIVDPWAGFVCHINDYETELADALEGCQIMVDHIPMTGEKFCTTLAGKFGAAPVER